MVLSLSRRSESMEHQTDLCLICDACLIVASMFRKHSTQCLSSNMLNYCGTVLWKWSRTSRNTHCFPCCGSCPSTPRWMGWPLDPFPGRLSTLRDLDAFQIDELTVWLLPCGCHLFVGQLNVAILQFWSRCYRPALSAATGFHVLSAEMVDGCYRFKKKKVVSWRP